MYHDVSLGLTGVQAEYLRSIVDKEADELAQELESDSQSVAVSDLEESLSCCEMIVNKLTNAIAEGIRNKGGE
jgi:hypothetical protein